MALQPEAVIIQAARRPGRDAVRAGAGREVIVLMAAVVRNTRRAAPPAFTNRERPCGARAAAA
ncbi:hypothetical protein AC230_04995 [Streptomyces caatingaensis]|uniref:Uncharacterized protein n=1 Tax=Streptomyces caatingaensis TaxID=1678637 RepID=A0A0K9XKM6_9ACTN|nr:hypothetical protein AC230_04995 [Streptomyces caatingaensis]